MKKTVMTGNLAEKVVSIEPEQGLSIRKQPDAQVEHVCIPNELMCEMILSNATKSDGGVLFANVPIQLLDIDPSYQRTCSSYRAKIARNWDEHKCKVPVCSHRNNRFYVVDGQNRMLAAESIGIRQMYCLIYTGLSQQEEAAIFADQDENRKRLTAKDRLKSDLTIGRPDAAAVVKLCREFGITYEEEDWAPYGALGGVCVARKIVIQDGEAMLRLIFQTIRDLNWHFASGSYSSSMLTIFARFYRGCERPMELKQALVRKLAGVDGPYVVRWRARGKYPHCRRDEGVLKYLQSLITDDNPNTEE